MSNRSTYIPLHGDVFTNKKTIAAAKALTKGDVHKMVGHLARLWAWALDRNDDGNLEHLTDRMIADAAGWKGWPSRFVATLIRVGFINPNRRIHDWKSYGGLLGSSRKADRKRKQLAREAARKLALEAAKQAETLMLSDGNPPTVRVTSDRNVTEPNLTDPNVTKRNVDADSDFGRVSRSASSFPSGIARVVNPEALREIAQDLLGVEGWPLEEKTTRELAAKLLAEFPDVRVEDLAFAVGDYRLMDPIKAKTAAAAFKAVRSWLNAYFRREHLKRLVEQLSDGRSEAMDEWVEELLEDAVGTSRFADMNAKDVEIAIVALEPQVTGIGAR